MPKRESGIFSWNGFREFGASACCRPPEQMPQRKISGPISRAADPLSDVLSPDGAKAAAADLAEDVDGAALLALEEERKTLDMDGVLFAARDCTRLS